MAVVVLSLAAIPLSVLVGALRDPLLLRRSRFWLRFAGLVVCMALPWTAVLAGVGGDDTTFLLLLIALGWGLLLVALAPLLLFRGPGSDPGPSDDSGGGPGPNDDPGPPDRPLGGLPLPDAVQGAWRLRGPHRPRFTMSRRRVARERERERRPVRLSSPWPCQDSNLGATDYESAALPTELQGRDRRHDRARR
jgi:hypothetical protein